MKEFKTLFWDLDGTIFNFKRCEIEALEDTFSQISILFDEEILNRYMEINDALWEKHEKGLISQEKLLSFRFELLFREKKIDISPIQVSNMYQGNLMNKSFFEVDALGVIKKLHKKYDLYIMTNGKIMTQNKRIEKAEIGRYFKDIFISEEIGFNKPCKEFFDECFKRIGLQDKSKAVIIGDSLSSDILGGINAGISTCWYNPLNKEMKKEIKCDYQVKSLKELLTIF